MLDKETTDSLKKIEEIMDEVRASADKVKVKIDGIEDYLSTLSLKTEINFRIGLEPERYLSWEMWQGRYKIVYSQRLDGELDATPFMDCDEETIIENAVHLNNLLDKIYEFHVKILGKEVVDE